MSTPNFPPYALRICLLVETDVSEEEAALGAERLVSYVEKILHTDRRDPALEWWVTWSVDRRDLNDVVRRLRTDRRAVRAMPPEPGGAAGVDNDVAQPTELERPLEAAVVEAALNDRRGYRMAIETSELVFAIGQVSALAESLQYALERERAVLLVDPAYPEPREVRRCADARRSSHPKAGLELENVPQSRTRLCRGYCQYSSYVHLATSIPLSPTDLERAYQQYRGHEDQVAEPDASALPPPDAEALEAVRTVILPHFVSADRLAIRFQRKHQWVSQALFYLGALAVTMASANTIFLNNGIGLLLGEIGVLVAVVGLHYCSHRLAWHEKWLNDRYLAERLRHLMFTFLLGAAHDPAYPQFLAFYKGPESWLLDFPRQLENRVVGWAPRDVDLESLRAFLLRQWVDQQIRHHEKNSAQKERLDRRYHTAGVIMFALTILAALMHVLIPEQQIHRLMPEVVMQTLSGWHPGINVPKTIEKGLTFVALVLPAWGGALQAIRNQLELPRISARSERMAAGLRVLRSRLEDAPDIETMRRAVWELREAMGAETHEWWVLLGFRDPALPA